MQSPDTKVTDSWRQRALQVTPIDLSHERNQFPPCYKTDERFFCSDQCQWRSTCQELTACWLRR
jgi:hypothetical protein